MKRYLSIVIAVVAVAILAVLILYFWKSFSLQNIAPKPSGGQTGSLPAATGGGSQGASTGNGQAGGTATGTTGNAGTPATGAVAGSFGPLANDPILEYLPTASGSALVIETNGIIGQVSGGKVSVISSSTASDVVGGSFSATGKKALIAFGNPSAPQTDLFDVATAKWTPLTQKMLSPSWSPTDNRVAYLTAASTGTEQLSIMDASTGKTSQLLALHANDLALQWVSSGKFALADRPSFLDAGSITMFDNAQGTLSPVVTETPGAEALWSGATGLLFAATQSGQGGSLRLVNASGSTLEALNLATLPSKCAFAQANTASGTSTVSYLALYCGIPRDAAAWNSASLPDDYNERALFTSDDIYRINTATGAIDVLWSDPSQHVDVSDMKVAGTEIYFIDRYTKKLYGFAVQP
ncbi:MAG TPA: hypothetical protein VMT99_02735 [Candidatus Paceibacterota bacterium]|nr:hypothetical protein [Candidatus Paceibacterota bacterium]